MSIFEEIGSDATKADSYVVVFKIDNPNMIGVLAVPSTDTRASSFRKLTKAISSHPRLGIQLEGYQATRRQTKQRAVYEIKFAVRAGMENAILEFFEYAKQARVIENPIISDMRDFKPN